MPYTYDYDGFYTSPSGKTKNRWIVRNPNGREIAECIGEGTANKIAKALNFYEKHKEKKS